MGGSLMVLEKALLIFVNKMPETRMCGLPTLRNIGAALEHKGTARGVARWECC
jgi:hypothetical protein